LLDSRAGYSGIEAFSFGALNLAGECEIICDADAVQVLFFFAPI
jgi:hypothetical protein